jgi:hypothetical protein
MTIVDDDSRVVNKLEASLTDNARVVIYDRHMFIVQITGLIFDVKTKSLLLPAPLG